MDWTQALAIVGSNVALIVSLFWFGTSLWLHTDKKVDEIHIYLRELGERVKSLEEKCKK